MESNSKTIKVSPDLFKIPQKTRKVKEKSSSPKPIKIKTDIHKTTKRRLLNYIREQQEQNYKKMVESGSIPQLPSPAIKEPLAKTSFEESVTYLENLKQKMDNKIHLVNPPQHSVPSPQLSIPVSTILSQTPSVSTPLASSIQKTLKQYSTPTTIGGFNSQLPHENVSLDFPVEKSPIKLKNAPSYGCLKGGTLPTYRNWINQTQKNTGTTATPPKPLRPLTLEQRKEEFRKIFEKNKENLQIANELKQAKVYLKKPPKQKRIIKRTFHIGKSKYHPKVGVLVSNKTIRQNITEKVNRLKQTSMEDVRKHLIRKGLIRVGSSCPPDVLRKMYESVSTLCGDLDNHNPENLLYNYINAPNEL
jgi:hypothetical protein